MMCRETIAVFPDIRKRSQNYIPWAEDGIS